MPDTASGRRYEFGRFRLNGEAGELYRNGIKLRLKGQPIRILSLLVECAGQVVTRQELRDRLWESGTYVEFDDSLNTAIGKLRTALNDDADRPLYIETIPRQGYRFIAPVEVQGDRVASGSAQGQATFVSAGSNSTSGAVVDRLAPEARQLRISRKAVIAGALALVAVLLVASAITIKMNMKSRTAPHVVRYVQLTHSGVVRPNQKLLTDGPRLYFIERTHGAWVGKWMLTTGGPATPLNLPFALYDLQDVSPDGDELIGKEFSGYDVKDDLLWTAPTSSGAPRRLAPGVMAAAYSTDGRSILYASGKQVVQTDRDGSHSHQLFAAPGEVLSLNPHDDRLRISLLDVDGTVTHWEAKKNGSGLHPLLLGWKEARPQWGGGWTPDGQWFIFSATRNGGRDLWLLGGAQPSRPVQLTSGPLEFRTPIFSHDGKRIFCVGILRRGELLRYRAANLGRRTAEPLWESGSNARPFTSAFGGMSAEQLEYSHDGKWVTYITYPDQVLWRARADGSERGQLTPSGMRVLGPQWSPNDSQIAFQVQPLSGEPSKLYLMSSSGGPQVELTGLSGIGGFTWSKDGSSLIIGDVRDGRLKLLDLRQRTLADIPQSDGLANPRLSPDGTYVAATIQPSETLVTFNLTSHQRRELARNAQYPTWSPDGHFIYFNSFEGSSPAMYRVNVSDDRIETLFTLDEFTVIGSWGFWSSVAPDGSILLMRDTGSSDVYAVDWELR